MRRAQRGERKLLLRLQETQRQLILQEKMASLRTQNLDDKIEIRIRDNGNGIPPEIRDKIFNPFFTTKPTGQGTGLGLSISYDIIVQEHKGEIKVETEEGEFTEFVVRGRGCKKTLDIYGTFCTCGYAIIFAFTVMSAQLWTRAVARSFDRQDHGGICQATALTRPRYAA
jgi:hypothetical protein